MKLLNIITKISLIGLLLIVAFSGCKKSADLSIDPIVRDTIFRFTPSHGYPGSTIKIEGTGLNDVTEVSFGVKAGEIVSKSDAEISVKIPVGALTGKIKLVKPTALLTSLTDFVVDITPIPTIIGFSPAIAGSGDTVTITGNLLDKVDSVFIGTLKATKLAGGTATSIQIKMPVGLKTDYINMYYNYMTTYGIQKVAISKSDKVLSLALPRITSINADITKLDVGQQIIIKGTMFNEVTKVTFVNRVAGYTASDTIKTAIFAASGDTMLTVTVPAGATTGVIKLTILDGTIQSSTFTVNLPAITVFDPFKGSSFVGIRSVYMTGTKFDLVDSVKIGSTKLTIPSKTSTGMMLNYSGTLGGFIDLYTKNGKVTSKIPFIITGDCWLTDGTDNVFDPVRLNAIYSNETTAAVDAVLSGGPTGKYHLLGGKTTANKTRTYITGKASGEDTYLLYDPTASDVTFSFDMSYTQLPANYINADSSVVIQIFSFTSGDRSPYGFNKNITVPFSGKNNWQHISVKLSDLVEANSSSLIGATPGSATANRCKPNKMRIMGIVFPNSPASAGLPISWNIDNVKFTIN